MRDTGRVPDWDVRDLRFPPAASLAEAARAGRRLVYYETCISLGILTLRQPSRVHIIPDGGHGFWAGVPYSLVTLALGWWGLPWGLLLTPHVLYVNCTGGRDVTAHGYALVREDRIPPYAGPSA